MVVMNHNEKTDYAINTYIDFNTNPDSICNT